MLCAGRAQLAIAAAAWRLPGERLAYLARDLDVLASRHHERPHRRSGVPSSTSTAPVAPSLAAASSATPRNPSPSAASARTRRRSLADAAREHERVEPAERRRHRRDRPAQAVDVDVEGEAAPRRRRPPLAPAPRACRPCPRAPRARTGAPGRRRSSAAATPALSEPRDDARVDRTRARRHHEPLERREAHRRVDGPAAAHGRERRARAQVAGDDAERVVALAPAQDRGATRGVRVRQPMEPVPPHAERSRHAARDRVGGGRIGQRGVERRVERRDVRQVRERRRDRTDPGQRPRLVQRRQRRQRLDARRSTRASSTTGAANRVPPWTTRCPTASAPPTRAIASRDERRVGLLDRRQVRRLEDGVARAEQPELAAARARVDDEDQACGVGHAQFAISGASSPSSRV